MVSRTGDHGGENALNMVKFTSIVKGDQSSMKIRDSYITLQSYLKFNGFIDTGAQSKIFLQDHDVLVNEIKETRRGRKLYPGDLINVDGTIDTIEA